MTAEGPGEDRTVKLRPVVDSLDGSLGLLGKTMRAATAMLALFSLGWGFDPAVLNAEQLKTRINNNRPFQNPAGSAATFSTLGFVDLTGEYFQVQGTNGRSCESCHIAQEAWSINPGTLQFLFDETEGTDPVFNPLDANNPDTGDFSTVEGRRAAYSMMLSRGVFRRGGALRADREWNLIAVDDPHGFANLTRLVHWRRVMPTINFAVGSATVLWDGGSTVGTDQHAGLVLLARRVVAGALAGPTLDFDDPILADIVDFQTSLSTAQLIMPGVGRLDSDGARGGPEALSTMTKVAGRFDLFDAWKDSINPRRAQIWRGQDLFNGSPDINGVPTRRRCGTCHSSANDGTSVNNTLFDIRTASLEARTPDLPLYTFQNKTTGEIRQLTDAGAGNITGRWNDLAHFKAPTLRALAARAPYFHNGIALTLEDVVRHYETRLPPNAAGLRFSFTDAERADLVAFLSAL